MYWKYIYPHLSESAWQNVANLFGNMLTLTLACGQSQDTHIRTWTKRYVFNRNFVVNIYPAFFFFSKQIFFLSLTQQKLSSLYSLIILVICSSKLNALAHEGCIQIWVIQQLGWYLAQRKKKNIIQVTESPKKTF